MNDLFLIVRELLKTHSLVIVPGLGGFVCNKTSAGKDKKTGRFYPPVVEIIFNSKLQHNDGLLTEAVAVAKKVSMDVAQRMVDDCVRGVNSSLQLTGRADLQGIGVMEKSGRNLILHAIKNSIENLDAFGLHEFYFPEIDQKEAERRNVPKQGRRDGGGLSVAAVICMCALLSFSQPVQRESPVAYQASLMFENPCDWIRTAHTKAEMETKYSVVLSRFEEAEEADRYKEEKCASFADSLCVIEIGEEYVVALPETKDWDKTVGALQMVRETQEDIPYPFILCRSVEKE